MSGRRQRSKAESKVEAHHQVIDLGRSVVEIATELTLVDELFAGWARAERARVQAAKRSELESLTCVERAALLRLCK